MCPCVMCPCGYLPGHIAVFLHVVPRHAVLCYSAIQLALNTRPCHTHTHQDDPSSPEYNVPARVDAFVAASHEWGGQMVGNDVLFMMGSDFQYANAHAWFINLDRCVVGNEVEHGNAVMSA